MTGKRKRRLRRLVNQAAREHSRGGPPSAAWWRGHLWASVAWSLSEMRAFERDGWRL